MDYKEKYKMAFERARKNYDVAQDLCNGSQIGVECFKNTLTNIFPELAESEDEKIRKNCIHFLELQKQHHATTFEIEECIAWLEKQDKQEILCDKCKKEQPSHSCQDMKTLMILDEAIEHCNEKSCDDTACGKNHKQLAEWLTELKGYRNYMRSFLDTLEVKEMDLEKEIEWIKHIYKVDNNRHTSICSADIEWLAEHFFELGIKATQKGE